MRGRNRGVSPVIAVILMVAITVILASVVGTYVLSIGNSVSEPPPNAVFEFEQKNETYDILKGGEGGTYKDEFYTVNIVYVAGPEIDLDNIQVIMAAGPKASQKGQAFWLDESDGWRRQWAGLDLPFRGDGRNPETIKSGAESGPLIIPYDPDNIMGDKSFSIQRADTMGRIESYNHNSGTGRLTMDTLDESWAHTHFARASPGTTVQVAWTGGSQKQVLAEYTVQEA